ncbi:hypothetical protein M0811_01783 [Anaeramoeba ignava]|uniref:Uncharacterized protein n=1 Tax=Anaeramoeba ignava TaxID=1746090 RepID=A0A9Q0LDD1_ANAIG|nr:hypothetical protein M0811_01783 [Anaeramoeba ignava]|eukprot:Anaeramoba_ignava/c20140_g2_i1.p1 GENE.c20140_g2_i1~~c20140_g2_i1.p1  ORF type:complete len:149 (-),score=19.48 c20140_g2_i1:32-478(-)
MIKLKLSARSTPGTICLMLFMIIPLVAFVLPSILVSVPDRDKDCPKDLWIWILVCNSVFTAIILLAGFTQSFFYDTFALIMRILNLILTLFLFAWAILGIIWARSNGVKSECGKLYSVTFGDSVALVVLMSTSLVMVIIVVIMVLTCL